jgi:hypothetical protein
MARRGDVPFLRCWLLLRLSPARIPHMPTDLVAWHSDIAPGELFGCTLSADPVTCIRTCARREERRQRGGGGRMHCILRAVGRYNVLQSLDCHDIRLRCVTAANLKIPQASSSVVQASVSAGEWQRGWQQRAGGSAGGNAGGSAGGNAGGSAQASCIGAGERHCG